MLKKENKYISLALLFLLIFCSNFAIAQNSNSFEIVYDEPNKIEKFFFKFQPFYGEMFVTNLNAGFGVEVNYFLENKWDFRFNYRRAYYRKFDFSKEIAKNNSINNSASSFNYLEIGSTFHIVDAVSKIRGKAVLFETDTSKSLLTVIPDFMTLSTNRRKIIGARFGTFFYKTSTDLNRALDKQGVTLQNGSGVLDNSNLTLINNISVLGVYFGSSLSLIRNYAIQFPESYSPVVEDLILNMYFDFLVAPSITLEEVNYQNEIYDTSGVKTRILGFRLGVDGMFNDKLGWAYGGELGYRPGIESRMFYALIKLSFPVFSTSFEKTSE